MKKRGMALMLVLTVASVVVMLTGAFVAANHANFASLGANQREREAEMAKESATQWCYYKLEENQNFGKEEFDQPDYSPPDGGLRIKRRSKNQLEGWLVDDKGSGREPHFTISIVNNLNSAKYPVSSAQEVGEISIPSDAVLLRVDADSGGFHSRCDILYRGEPLFDASITAKSLSLSTNNHIKIASTDKNRNWVRSNSDIILNDSSQSDVSTKFVAAADGSNADGVIWAKGDIKTQALDGASDPKTLSGAELANVANSIGGTLAPKSRVNHDIYKLAPEDLRAGPSKSDQAWGGMAPGTYALNSNEDGTFKYLTYTAPDGSTKNWYYGIGDSVDGAWVGAVDGVVRIGGVNTGGAAMKYDFFSNTFTLDNSAIFVDGDLKITSNISGDVPTISLTSSDWSSGALRAKGSIELQGTLSGDGALVAGNTLRLMCNPKDWSGEGANVDADKSSGVVLFGHDVNIYAGSNHNISFKGLIYAENDVNLYGGLKKSSGDGGVNWVPEDAALDKLQLEGAVVARNGHVNIGRTKEVTLTYNPTYLNTLTKGMPDDRRRIGHVWTRTY